jgi:hypothetical protein
MVHVWSLVSRWQLIHFHFSFLSLSPSLDVDCHTFHVELRQFASSMTTATASYGDGNNHTSQRGNATINYEQLPSVDCIVPSYFNHFAVLILIATTVITQLSHLTKIIIMIIFTCTYCVIDGFLFDTPFRHEVYESWNP